ncbi:MAG: DUF1801 domain-containing protein [Cyclobacteriaceae bacterium]
MNQSQEPYGAEELHIANLTVEDHKMLQQIRQAIMQADPMVDERIGKHLQYNHALLYEQEGVFKYGLFRGKNYFTFRSAVMYKYPEVRQEINRNTFFRVQKGCVNFVSLQDFPMKEFKQWLRLSASMPFLHVGESLYY